MHEISEPLITLQIRLPKPLLDRIDRYRLSSSMRPTRSMTIRFLLTNAVEILEEELKHETHQDRR